MVLLVLSAAYWLDYCLDCWVSAAGFCLRRSCCTLLKRLALTAFPWRK